jgi:hypothetical protein
MYKATQNLLLDNLKINVNVKFVIYHIDNTMPIPYLRIHLVRDCDNLPEELNEIKNIQDIEAYTKENEFLTFPSIEYNAGEHFLFNLYCQGVVESLFHEEREYVQHIQHKGYVLEEDTNTAYAFFELTPTTTEAEFINRGTFIWTVLMDEILHKNVVCEMPIHSVVTSFFMEHPSFIYLSDVDADVDIDNTEGEHLVYEMPVVVYYPVADRKKTQFIAMFGATRSEGDFVFYSYNRALDIIKDEYTGSGGLVRIALYTGNATIDKEEYNDHPEVDTFYHGNEYRTKKYEQQKPLSYHSVVKGTIII